MCWAPVARRQSPLYPLVVRRPLAAAAQVRGTGWKPVRRYSISAFLDGWALAPNPSSPRGEAEFSFRRLRRRWSLVALCPLSVASLCCSADCPSSAVWVGVRAPLPVVCPSVFRPSGPLCWSARPCVWRKTALTMLLLFLC